MSILEGGWEDPYKGAEIREAERAVVEAAIRGGTVKNDMDYRNACDVLRSHVITIIRLRAARKRS